VKGLANRLQYFLHQSLIRRSSSHLVWRVSSQERASQRRTTPVERFHLLRHFTHGSMIHCRVRVTKSLVLLHKQTSSTTDSCTIWLEVHCMYMPQVHAIIRPLYTSPAQEIFRRDIRTYRRPVSILHGLDALLRSPLHKVASRSRLPPASHSMSLHVPYVWARWLACLGGSPMIFFRASCMDSDAQLHLAILAYVSTISLGVWL
jgi:hypothetical protein